VAHMKKQKKISKRELFRICETCLNGSCCRDGVDADLEEAKKISKLKLKLKRPWFQDLFRDKDMPSGWAVAIIIKNGRCIFQKKDKRCSIYKYRPWYCREFPLENGQIAGHYHYLCEKPPGLKHKVKRHLKHLRKKV